VISILRNKEGNAALMACVVVLCMFLIFSVISEYLRLEIIAKDVRDATQTAVISVATQNYDEVYNGLREGYSGGYTLDESDTWRQNVDNGAVYVNLSDILNLIDGARYSGSEVEYTISNIDVDIINVPIASGNNGGKFESIVTLELHVPLSFGWDYLEPLKIKLKVNAGYTPKF